jgi:hypothetical protein
MPVYIRKRLRYAGKAGLATDEHGTVIHHWCAEMKLAIDADRVAQFVN